MNQEEIANKAREHANQVSEVYGSGVNITSNSYKLRAKNSYQQGYSDALSLLSAKDERIKELETALNVMVCGYYDGLAEQDLLDCEKALNQDKQ